MSHSEAFGRAAGEWAAATGISGARALREADERDATLGCIGGKVDPIWEAPRPAWLSDQVALGLTIVDWSERTKAITDLKAQWLVGTNIAFRRAALVMSRGFHPALDRAGARMLSSGDVYLTKQILELGYECEYVPAMRVRHRVPNEFFHHPRNITFAQK